MSDADRSSRRRFQRFRYDELPRLRKFPEGHEHVGGAASASQTDAGASAATPGAQGASVSAEDRRALRRRYLREYVTWLRTFAPAIVVVLLLALMTNALALVLPWATMHIIDVVLPQRDWRGLQLISAGLFGVIVVQQALDTLRHFRTVKLNYRILFRLRRRLFQHLLRLPLHTLYELRTGSIVTRLASDIDAVGNLLQMAILTPTVSGVRVVLTLAALFLINWKMALAGTLIIPPVILLNLAYIRRIRPIYRSIRRDRSDIDARVVETFAGIRIVRAFRREASEMLRFGQAHHTVIRKQLMARIMEFIVWAGWGVLTPLSALAIVWLGGSLVLLGQGTIGGIMAFQMYTLMLLAPVSSIVQSYGETQQALAAMERVFDLLRQPADKPDRPDARSAPRRVDEIRFDRVWFGYDPEHPVLRDIDIAIPGGSTVALVGPSGAGKTTFTHLVARFYDPQRGAVRLNGEDIRDFTLRSYRRLLGIVQQETFLFDGTVEENIAYGRREAARAEVEQAARRANAHEFIVNLPEGYTTRIGERGVKLSGGQAQRLSIARALLADPSILILDEATSNLDTASEQLIQAALRELLRGRTTFVVAHRLSTVMHADLIIVLENGQITETGTHAELMSLDQRYRAMVERQQRASEAGEAGAPAAADWLA